jgi:alkanesulfonate monooxygenase SsuD/methylene tetrahydromethanopterin reductase-like flavin-dependent oxidoreductase (luciferase family)
MRFSLFVMGSQSGAYADILAQAQQAEELRFDTVFLAERHFRHAGLLFPSPLGMAAAIAACTRRLRVGTAARILPLDHPLHIAQDAATLDVLSGGRLEFGVTRGSLDDEAHAAFTSPREEAAGRFEEALRIIRLAWTRERFSFDGRYYRIPEVSVSPRPLQRPHPPIVLVAPSPERVAFAAAHGYAAIAGALSSATELGELARIYEKARAESGNNHRPAGLAVNRFVYVGESDRAAHRAICGPFGAFLERHAPDLRAAVERKYGAAPSLERCLEDFCLFGSPKTVAARIRQLQDATGTSHLLCTLNFITVDHRQCLRSMELFAREVMPRFGAPVVAAKC